MKRFLTLLAIAALVSGGNAAVAVSQPSRAQATPVSPSAAGTGCVNGGKDITNRSTKYLDDSEKALGQITEIRSEVTDFYTAETRDVGLKVPSYPTLFKQMSESEAVSEKSLEKARGDLAKVDCQRLDTIGTFHGDINGLTRNLKTYRGLVRSWIVNVRTADIAAHKPSPTPAPSGPPVLP